MRADPAFESFVRDRSAALLRTAYLLTGDYGHAEDLLQVTLLRTLRHWRHARETPEAYARQVLVNLSKDRWRWLRRRPPETALLPGTDDAARGPAGTAAQPAELIEQRHVLIAALAALPAGQRQVIVLRFFEDLPVAQTAELLGLSPGTVKSYTARGIAALRTLLAEDSYAEDSYPARHHDTSEASRAH